MEKDKPKPGKCLFCDTPVDVSKSGVYVESDIAKFFVCRDCLKTQYGVNQKERNNDDETL